MHVRETRKPRMFRLRAHAGTRVSNPSVDGALAFARGSLGWRHELPLAAALSALSVLLLRSRG